MNDVVTIRRRVVFEKNGREKVASCATSANDGTGRVPRISRLMALAIRFEQLYYEGVVKDFAELARLGRVTRARLSQIMNLTLLAPDIQEEILFLPTMLAGRDWLVERDVRAISAPIRWAQQREIWRRLIEKKLRPV